MFSIQRCTKPIAIVLVCLMVSACLPAPVRLSSHLCLDEELENHSAGFLWQTQALNGVARPLQAGTDVVVAIDRNWEAMDGPGEPWFLNQGSDTILALDVRTGDRRWEASTQMDGANRWYVRLHAVSPSYYAVVASTDAGENDFLLIFDLKSGQPVIKTAYAATDVPSELAVSEAYVFVTLRQAVHAFSLPDGALVWQDAPGSRVVEDGLLYSPETGLLYVVDAQVAARNPDTGEVMASLPKGGRDFFVSADYMVTAGTRELGVQSWSTEPAHTYDIAYSRGLWPPVIADGKLYVLDRQSRLHIVSLESHETVTWSVLTGDVEAVSQPVLMNSKVFFIASDGTLRSVNHQTGHTQILLRNRGLRYRGNLPGGYTEHYWPGLASVPGRLVVTFGCKNIVAVTVP